MSVNLQAAVSDATLPGHSTVQYRIVDITPDYATHLLDVRRPGARRHAGTVRAFSQVMRSGDWVMNAMPLIVSRQGVLLDGVQRLLACIEAEADFRTFLASGVDDRVCHTIDQQRRRSFANVLEAAGLRHGHAVQTTLLRLLRLDAVLAGRPDPQRPSWATLAGLLTANPHLPGAVAASLAVSGCPLPEPVRSPIVCMGYSIDAGRTDRLIDALLRPGLYPPGEPGVLLANEVGAWHESEASRRSNSRLMALSIRALDATLRGVALARLSWIEHGEDVEPFPRLAGYAGLAPAAPMAAFRPPDASENEQDEVVRFAIERIDAARAGAYLAHNTGNRHVSRAHVSAIARDLAQGRWMFNAQPICFAEGGQLLNGQHRLHAVILAGSEIEVLVARGLIASAYPTYDTQARRRAHIGDQFSSFGDQALAHAMANLLWRHELRAGASRSARATAAEIHQIVAQHPRLLLLRSLARRMGVFGRASVIGYAAYVMERDDAALARQFIAMLETGADLRPNHPVLALRSALQFLRIGKASQDAQLAALLDGWRAFRTGPIGNGRSV